MAVRIWGPTPLQCGSVPATQSTPPPSSGPIPNGRHCLPGFYLTTPTGYIESANISEVRRSRARSLRGCTVRITPGRLPFSVADLVAVAVVAAVASVALVAAVPSPSSRLPTRSGGQGEGEMAAKQPEGVRPPLPLPLLGTGNWQLPNGSRHTTFLWICAQCTALRGEGPQFSPRALSCGCRSPPHLHAPISDRHQIMPLPGHPQRTSSTPPLHRPRNPSPSPPVGAPGPLERAATSPALTRPHNLTLKRRPASVVQDRISSAPPRRPPRHRTRERCALSMIPIDLQSATTHASSRPRLERRPPTIEPGPRFRLLQPEGERPDPGPHQHTTPPHQSVTTTPPRNHTLPGSGSLDVSVTGDSAPPIRGTSVENVRV